MTGRTPTTRQGVIVGERIPAWICTAAAPTASTLPTCLGADRPSAASSAIARRTSRPAATVCTSARCTKKSSTGNRVPDHPEDGSVPAASGPRCGDSRGSRTWQRRLRLGYSGVAPSSRTTCASENCWRIGIIRWYSGSFQQARADSMSGNWSMTLTGPSSLPSRWSCEPTAIGVHRTSRTTAGAPPGTRRRGNRRVANRGVSEAGSAPTIGDRSQLEHGYARDVAPAQTDGRRSTQGRSSSSWAATRMRRSSLSDAALIMTPMGSPSEDMPSGRLMDGWPVKLN